MSELSTLKTAVMHYQRAQHGHRESARIALNALSEDKACEEVYLLITKLEASASQLRIALATMGMEEHAEWVKSRKSLQDSRLVPFNADLRDRLLSLVSGVDIHIDAPLSPDDE